MKILIDGIATVWLQKRGLPTRGTSTPEEYKAKVEAYLIANPTDWPYYNRKGRLDPFYEAPHVQEPEETPPPSLPQRQPEDRQVPQGVESKEKVYYVVVRHTPLGIREYLKTLAYPDQKEHQKWSEDPAWADRFLEPYGASLLAKRILGHNKFKVEPL
jgi:hypothetical protein